MSMMKLESYVLGTLLTRFWASHSDLSLMSNYRTVSLALHRSGTTREEGWQYLFHVLKELFHFTERNRSSGQKAMLVKWQLDPAVSTEELSLGVQQACHPSSLLLLYNDTRKYPLHYKRINARGNTHSSHGRNERVVMHL